MNDQVVIVGAGLYGAVMAQRLYQAGYKCVVLERRNHVGGNCYTRPVEGMEGVHEHVYGPHAFHTNNHAVWDYVNRFVGFDRYELRVKACVNYELYSFPINLMTLHQVMGIMNPEEARSYFPEVEKGAANLEDWCLRNIGSELYDLFIRDYTRKQWGRDPKELPASFVTRLPIRMTFDDRYHSDVYQGVPENGYTEMFERMLVNIPVFLNIDFMNDRDNWVSRSDLVVYTGSIDEFLDYEFGTLEYRSLRFIRRHVNMNDFQGCAVINYPSSNVSYTRVIEHKHLCKSGDFGETLVSYEMPVPHDDSRPRYYPVPTVENRQKLERYQRLAKSEFGDKVVFGGRLGEYRYYNMDQTIEAALSRADEILEAM